VASLNEEVELLQCMGQDLFLELSDLLHRAAADRANALRPLWHLQLQAAAGCALAVLCAVRVVLALYNVISRFHGRAAIQQRGEGADLATTALELLDASLKHGQLHSLSDGASGSWGGFDVSLWAKVFSFSFIGVLMLSSARAFLVTAWHSRTALGGRKGGSGAYSSFFGALALFIGSDDTLQAALITLLMGMYLLASVLLLRINVPCEYRGGALAVVRRSLPNFFPHFLILLRARRDRFAHS
jgi:hypothetical protein